MGCVSSKLVAKEIAQEKLHENGDYAHHVVSLTSTTYGALSLDKEKGQNPPAPAAPPEQESEINKSSPPRGEEPSEIINAWELMEGLEEEIAVVVQSKRSSPKSKLFLKGFSDKDPLKFLSSPRKAKKVVGKENKGRVNSGIRSLENSPRTVLKESNNFRKLSPRLWASVKASPKCNSSRFESGLVPSKRRSLGPSLEKEEIKKMSSTSSFLESYNKKCPPRGKNAVVIYTTTLRGIRKTFEDCNVVRSIIETQNVETSERDISMHSAFKEELRELMGRKDVRVPIVFVKGRLIGGAEEMVKLDEEGKLGILFDGIPAAAAAACGRCGGVRFVLCVECSGSCRVVGGDGRKSVRCGECNENGLIQCPKCCSTL